MEDEQFTSGYDKRRNEMDEGLIGLIGAFGVVAVMVLGILTIMIPVTIYLAQRYAHKCFLEVKEANIRLKTMNDNIQYLKTMNEGIQYLAEVEANKLRGVAGSPTLPSGE